MVSFVRLQVFTVAGLGMPSSFYLLPRVARRGPLRGHKCVPVGLTAAAREGVGVANEDQAALGWIGGYGE